MSDHVSAEHGANRRRLMKGRNHKLVPGEKTGGTWKEKKKDNRAMKQILNNQIAIMELSTKIIDANLGNSHTEKVKENIEVSKKILKGQRK